MLAPHFQEILALVLRACERADRIATFDPSVIDELKRRLAGLSKESGGNIRPSQLLQPAGPKKSKEKDAKDSKIHCKTGDKVDKSVSKPSPITAAGPQDLEQRLNLIASKLLDLMSRAETEGEKIDDELENLNVIGLELKILSLKTDIVKKRMVAMEKNFSLIEH